MNLPDFTPISTERLLLRPLTLDDAPGLYAYARNPNVARYTFWNPHQSIEDSISMIRDYAFPYYQAGEVEPLGIALRSEPENIIGTVGVRWAPRQHSSMELAYALAEEHWGKGIAAEAAHALIDFCFRTIPVNRIQAHYKAENRASGRVMEKLGMNYEGTQREKIFHQGRFWDAVFYATLRKDWEQNS